MAQKESAKEIRAEIKNLREKLAKLEGEENTDINDEKQFHQKMLFKGVGKGLLHPTDIDGLFDLKGQGFLMIESKYKDNELLTGQRICFENMTKCFKDDKLFFGAVVEHDEKYEDYYFADCRIREIYAKCHGQYVWLPSQREMTGEQFMDWLYENFIEKRF